MLLQKTMLCIDSFNLLFASNKFGRKLSEKTPCTSNRLSTTWEIPQPHQPLTDGYPYYKNGTTTDTTLAQRECCHWNINIIPRPYRKIPTHYVSSFGWQTLSTCKGLAGNVISSMDKGGKTKREDIDKHTLTHKYVIHTYIHIYIYGCMYIYIYIRYDMLDTYSIDSMYDPYIYYDAQRCFYTHSLALPGSPSVSLQHQGQNSCWDSWHPSATADNSRKKSGRFGCITPENYVGGWTNPNLKNMCKSNPII